MIPERAIKEWQQQFPWLDSWRIEQDLLLTRAIIEIFRPEPVRCRVALLGGTALHKLYVRGGKVGRGSRHSEDIDLVWTKRGKEDKGDLRCALEGALAWMGPPASYRHKQERLTVLWRVASPPRTIRIKIEVNLAERSPVLPLVKCPLAATTSWCRVEGKVVTYQLDELLATKMRAMLERRKGRDSSTLPSLFEDFLDSGPMSPVTSNRVAYPQIGSLTCS